jgi:hypothetical protein
MPKSVVAHAVDGSWESITKAVKAGLSYDGRKPLADLVPTAGASLSDPSWQPGAWKPEAGGSRVRVCDAAGGAKRYEHRHRINFEDLEAPPPDAITAWATRARDHELTYALHGFACGAEVSTKHLKTLNLTGWGELRCVIWIDTTMSLAEIPNAEWATTSHIKVPGFEPKPTNAIGALFRSSGGPVVKRFSDLTLGWLPANDDAIDLVLVSCWKLTNVSGETVALITP